MAKLGKALLLVFGCIVILVAIAYGFRIDLLRAGINAALTGDTTVTRLQGVQLGSTHAEIAEVELSLGPGQRFVVSGIAVDYRMRGLFNAPLVQNLTIASARLTDDLQEQVAADSPVAPSVENGAVQQTGLLLSELLQQLRDFPLVRMDLETLQLPQFRQPLALHVAQQADALQMQLATGGLELLASFSQAGADAAGRFELTLQADGQVLVEADVSLTPQPSGYQLAGSGNVAIPDANMTFAEYLTTPLPVSDIAAEWDVAAAVNDDLLSDQAGVISLGVAPASSFTLNEGFVSDLGELAVVIPQRAELHLAPGEMRISGTLPLQMSGTWQQQPLQTTLTLTPTECFAGSILDCSIGFDGSVSLAAFALAGADANAITTISMIDFAGSGNARVDSDVVEVELAPGARLGSAMVTAPAYSIGSVALVSDAALSVSKKFADSGIVIVGDQALLTVNELEAGAYSTRGDLALRAISLTLAEEITGRVNVQTAGFAVSGPQWLPTIGIDADLAIDGDTLTFSTPLRLQNPSVDAPLQATGFYDVASGAAGFHLQLADLTLTGEGNSLSSFLNGWPYEADVMSGTLALALDVEVQPAPAASGAEQDDPVINANTTIALTDVAGFYAENFFRGLNARIEAAYDSSSPTLPLTTPPSTLTLDELNVGLPITDIALDYQLDARSQIVNINSIFARALDGTIGGMNIRYDLSKDFNQFDLSFSNLRLERMMELAEYEGIEANGAVSGELPVTVREGQIEIDAGRLYAEAPGGSIRYLNAPPAGGNPAMDLVNQALSNYQFQSLESAIDYTPDGELLLAMQLRGHNPDMNGGQAINLNLNISDNIPTLLKSLQAGRVIEDFLQEQYK